MVKIRQASGKDVAEIKKLIKMYPTKLMQGHLPAARSFFVAVENKKVIGCCALQVYSKRLAEVRSLVVHPKHQNQGLAKGLIAKCMERAEKQGILEVISITGAVGLFEKFGFKTFQKEKYAMIKLLKA